MDACFYVRPGKFSKRKGAFSLESVNYRNHYIGAVNGGRLRIRKRSRSRRWTGESSFYNTVISCPNCPGGGPKPPKPPIDPPRPDVTVSQGTDDEDTTTTTTTTTTTGGDSTGGDGTDG